MLNRFLQACTIFLCVLAGYVFVSPDITFPPEAVAASLEKLTPLNKDDATLVAEERKKPSIAKKLAKKPKKIKKMFDKDHDGVPGTKDDMMTAEPVIYRSTDAVFPRERQEVQAVLVAKNAAVISSTVDGRLIKFPFKSGDTFEEGDLLAEYDCRVDQSRLKETEARRRLTEKQLKAYNELKDLDAIANIELVSAQENHKQNEAVVEQVRGRINLCKITAPFRGRVTNKMASEHEFVQTGRVLMEIASRETLEVEFLVPSIWLRWLNVGTPMDVYIQESGKTYTATVVRIHGEVDPVSQSVQITGEINGYQEELLPGMSGRAVFTPEDVRRKTNFGFIGLMLSEPGAADQASP